jgi:hypothetical protein
MGTKDMNWLEEHKLWCRLVDEVGLSNMEAFAEIAHLRHGTVCARTCPGLTALDEKPEIHSIFFGEDQIQGPCLKGSGRREEFVPPLNENHHARRKAQPLARGCLDYFPDALLAVAELSMIANEQHNPGQPMHWAKEKSADHADCLARHLLQRGETDPTSGLSHTVAVAWRALALLQTEIEASKEPK